MRRTGPERPHAAQGLFAGVQDHVHRQGLAVPLDGQTDGIAHGVAAPHRQQIAGDGDGLAVRLQNDIAGLHTGLRSAQGVVHGVDLHLRAAAGLFDGADGDTDGGGTQKLPVGDEVIDYGALSACD